MNIRLDQGLHRRNLIGILKDVYTSTKISHLLGFKGGTALYLFYELTRFSVDLDFDLLEKDKEEYVFQELINIISKYGEIKDQQLKNFGSLISVSYKKGLHQLKVDVSNRESIAKYELKNHMGVPMKVMALEDMAANKLLALVERKKPANRDLFDCYFLLDKYVDINEEILKYRSGISLIEQLRKAINYVEIYDDRDILQGLGELVSESQKPWIKNKLKQELLFQLRVRLENMEKIQC